MQALSQIEACIEIGEMLFIEILELHLVFLINNILVFKANLPALTPGRQPGSARSSLSSVRSSASSVKSPSGSAMGQAQIGADFAGMFCYGQSQMLMTIITKI
jgi:hypothetical protein